MRRNLTKPGNPALAHGNIGIQPFGDRPVDDCGFFLLQQLDEPPLLRDEIVDLLGFLS